MMDGLVRCNLVVELDEESQRFVIFLLRKQAEFSAAAAACSIDINIEDLLLRGPEGAERMIGRCVLDVFDRLTDGHLDLPRHYLTT